MADNSFHFINTTGPKVPKDPALRTLIRKQAMKDVAIARKKRGGLGRVNLRQLPSETDASVQNGSADSISSSTDTSEGSCVTPDLETEALVVLTNSNASTPDEQLVLKQTNIWLAEQDWMASLRAPPASDYERMRMKYHFDIRDLSILTSFNIGKGTMFAISCNPGLLNTLLGSQVDSYLRYMPSRYGRKPFLTAVIDCVCAKAHSKLYPRNGMFENLILQMYARALAAVQEAVSGGESSLDSDLLCAIQMLSLHEMLEPDRTEAYMHHINGSALVIKRRGAASFKTDYEKMLFHAHIGPIFSEALMNNKRCYLDQPEWVRLYESLIEETPHLTDRSELVIRIRMKILSLSHALPATTEAVNPDKYDEGTLLTLELKARETHAAILKYLDDFKAHLVRTAMSHVPASELAHRREVFGTALEVLLVYKRILATFCEPERLHLEAEAQTIATQIFELQKQPAPRHSWIYSVHEQGVAAVVQLTRQEWERDLSQLTLREKQRIAYDRWVKFNNFLHVPEVPGARVAERNPGPV